MRHPRVLLPLLLSLLLATARAAPSEWPDADGTRFQGEPAGILGSLALFRTTEPVLKRVPLRALSEDDCRRLHAALAARPPRAPNWSAAQGAASRELVGAVKRLDYQYRRMVPAEIGNRPEPELLVIFYSYHNAADSWLLSNNIMPIHRRMQRAYPGLTATVFYGLWHDAEDHDKTTVQSWAPWLATDFAKQKNMPVIGRHAPPNGSAVAVITREGDLVMSVRPTNLDAIRQFIDDFTELLWTANPLNSRASTDRAYYSRAVRALEYASTDTGPQLIGNPLRADGLRQRNISRVEAHLEIDATGKVTTATLQPNASVPEKMAAPLADALRRSVFLPAMAHGAPVASTYDYVLEVPPANPEVDADVLWMDRSMRGEIPLLSWRILRSIPVPQQEFDEIEGIGADGKVTLRAFEVSDRRVSRESQVSAFKSDFFGEGGAGSVAPEEGAPQVVNGKTYTWQSIQSRNGYVDLREGIFPQPEYCIGYAWTEIEVSADVQTWLGIGSDDGIKIWLNGELVNDRWARRGSRIDDDIVPLRLKAGKNRLLIKIQNITGHWSFITRLRFRDR